MAELLDSLRRELEAVDLAEAEKQLPPPAPSDNVIGVLNDDARRLNTLALACFAKNRELLKEHQELSSRPATAKEIADWVARSRTNRLRITVLTGMFALSVNRQFPGAIIHEFMLVRQGWRLVWKDRLDPEDLAFLGAGPVTTVH